MDFDIEQLAMKRGVTVRTIWRRLKAGKEPQPDMRSARGVFWTAETIRTWDRNKGDNNARNGRKRRRRRRR